MKRWHLVVIILLLLAAVVWADRRRSAAVAQADVALVAADSLARLADSAKGVADSLTRLSVIRDQEYTADTVSMRGRIAYYRALAARAGRVDTVAGVPDTVEVTIPQIIAAADSALGACEAVVTSCEARVALERERVTVEQGRVKIERERGDSAVSAAEGYRRAMRGPFLRPAVQGLVSPDLDWLVAAQVTLGRGSLKALLRGEVANGSETCGFSQDVDAYTCSTPVEATLYGGVEWRP